jgi:diguanylate cyclase (GGDEF)-like protein
MNEWKRIAQRLKILNRDHEQLDQMVAELHACRTFAEAYQLVADFAQRLLPGLAGALYMRKNGIYDRAQTWGQLQGAKRHFALEECCALHRMKTHLVGTPNGLGCPHVIRPAGSYVCLPLMLDGQALGVLHLQSTTRETTTKGGSLLKARLAERMARHCAQKLGQLRERERFYNQAVRDALTGLFNRGYMEESLLRELALRTKRCVALIMLDIDHFKDFNTRFTHQGADVLLRAFGGFLQKHVRGADVACRYGGEEFVLILPGATLKVAHHRAEQIRKEIKRLKVTYQGRTLRAVTLSLGIAASDEHGSRAEELLAAAAVAVRQAKQQGRDRVIAAPGRAEDARRGFDPKSKPGRGQGKKSLQATIPP